jgi:hypothetical protein
VISVHDESLAGARARLVGFRREFYSCLTARADALFELADAVLCVDGPVVSLPELSLTAVHRRGHGAMYDALASGRIDPARLTMVLAGLPLPRRGGQLVVAIDVSPWPRPDAECSPQRLHCHRPCRCDGVRQTIPGWPYSVAAALGTGRSSWTAPLDIRRLAPQEDPTEATAAQIRELHARLTAVGQLPPEDPPLLVVLDSGYDLVRLTWLLGDLPIRLLGRLRSDRVLFTPAGPRRGTQPGRQPRHGHRFAFGDPTTHSEPHTTTSGSHPRYGATRARAWQHLHPRPERRGAWSAHPGQLPLVEGTIINLTVEHLPGNRTPKPVWLWFSHPITDTHTGTDAGAVVDHLWRTYLRRFDLEHTFRFFKQTLGFTRPRPRHGDQADRWARLIVAAYTQLHLARPLAPDLRRPWEKPLPANKITPGRVRRTFPRIRATTGNPARAPKATHPGPGRPPGHTSHPAPRHPVGKTPKTP